MMFTRYTNNPIITKGTGTWDSSDIANPDVFFDIPNNRWVMNYSAYGTIPADASPKWRMCLAYSTDLFNWTKEPLNPIFQPNASEGYISCNGSIVYKNGVYYHFYQTGDSGQPVTTKIRLATSNDLINWTRQNSGQPVIVGTANTFDSVSCYDPCVKLMADGATFEMTYSAKSSNANSIGKAISTDGINWTKQGKILDYQTWFSTANFAEPAFMRADNALYLTWDASIITDVRSVALALTFTEGSSWQFIGYILNGSGSGWDSLQVFDSYIIYHDSKIYLFYAGGTLPSGNQGMNSQIGLAVTEYLLQSK